MTDKIEETNRKALRLQRLEKLLSCTHCAPHKHDNATRTPAKHGRTKPRYKDRFINKKESDE